MIKKLPLIDNFLNGITIYRLMLYYLLSLVGIAVIASFFGLIGYSALDIGTAVVVIMGSCMASNYLFAKALKAVTNVESVFITAFILVLIMPLGFPANIIFYIVASFVAMASKYILAISKRHIFNPAAVSVAILGTLYPQYVAAWWVSASVMSPFVLFGGFLLVRKMRRENLVLTFLLLYLVLIGMTLVVSGESLRSVVNVWKTTITESPLLFFAFVMLIEPQTSPGTRRLQLYYGSFMAVLYAIPQFRLVTMTPELVLCIGNIFSYIVSPKYRLLLALKEKRQLTADTVLFNFGKIEKFSFTPGQYMEWTLSHKNSDTRGNRRYFSITSSPSEELQIAVKFYDHSSSYKKALHELTTKQEIVATSLAGDFILPKNPQTPVVFIAGGVGITPFRSIIKDIVDKKTVVDIILFFANRTKDDILFTDVLGKAKAYGVKTVYTLTDEKAVPANWKDKVGHITAQMIQEEVPDYKNRLYYISGPQPMVQSYEVLLHTIDIPSSKIIVDYFPGYNAE